MSEERAPYGTDELIESLRFRPPTDPVFAYLYDRLSIGELPLFQGEVAIDMIDPFAPDFRPWDYQKGKGAFQFMLHRIKAGTRSAMWVYPKGGRFVVSDDYFTLEAARQLGLRDTQIRAWKKQFDAEGAKAFPGNGNRGVLEEEVHRLRVENKRLVQERDLLKKVSALFAKDQR